MNKELYRVRIDSWSLLVGSSLILLNNPVGAGSSGETAELSNLTQEEVRAMKIERRKAALEKG